jgi:hypothetical protein
MNDFSGPQPDEVDSAKTMGRRLMDEILENRRARPPMPKPGDDLQDGKPRPMQKIDWRKPFSLGSGFQLNLLIGWALRPEGIYFIRNEAVWLAAWSGTVREVWQIPAGEHVDETFLRVTRDAVMFRATNQRLVVYEFSRPNEPIDWPSSVADACF